MSIFLSLLVLLFLLVLLSLVIGVMSQWYMRSYPCNKKKLARHGMRWKIGVWENSQSPHSFKSTHTWSNTLHTTRTYVRTLQKNMATQHYKQLRVTGPGEPTEGALQMVDAEKPAQVRAHTPDTSRHTSIYTHEH